MKEKKDVMYNKDNENSLTHQEKQQVSNDVELGQSESKSCPKNQNRKYKALQRSLTSLKEKSTIESSDIKQSAQDGGTDTSTDNEKSSSDGTGSDKSTEITQSPGDVSKSDKSTEKTQSSSNGADSKNSDQHWQSCVDKLNAETAAVLESIKGTSWKEADGTFTKDATKGLDMLSKAYFELSNQNAPLVYVRTSRDDLAKAIIKAKIIPNICDVLTYVYKQNLELSDSHGYYDIGIDARKILCNFALHYDEFANEIANFPGFLEFLKEYLQSKEQETALEDRLTGFIKIISNISRIKVNIIRLLSVNMRDALTPYLKARIHDFQLFSLRTLVRIIIGETFGSNENSHNSENAAHDWQIVVKKVTGLISKEVTDLSGTEWKDEDGTYNTSVINLLRLIKIVNSELGRHNAPLVYTLQSPKDIARTMIDANIVRNICGVLTDLHQQTLVITDNERNKMLSSYVRNILWNYTDSDADFVEHVASVPGFLEFLIDKLASESKYHLHLHEEAPVLVDDHILLCFVDIAYNISMVDTCRTRLRKVKTIEVLQPFLKSPNPDIQIGALATLAGVIDEEESDIIKSNEESVIVLMDKLRQGLQAESRRSKGQSNWSCKECAMTIRTLARNDANKKLLVQLGALELLVELTKGNEDEQTEAVRAIWALSFDEDNRKVMVQDEKLEVFPALEKLKDSHITIISKAAYGILWNLREFLQNSKLERFRNIVKTVIAAKTQKESYLQGVAREQKLEGHIMISYQWSHQKTLLMVKEALVRNGFKVWMDVEQMMGSIAQAMAEAVENSDIVLICLSHKYKNSEPCRQEAEYANLLKKKIVPLKLEDRYRPDGWLGLIASRFKYYDFSGHRPIKSEMNDLLSALRKMREDLISGLDENTLQIQAHEHVDGPGSHGSLVVPDVSSKCTIVRQWKEDDVQSWINKNNLPKEHFGNLTADKIALLLRMESQVRPDMRKPAFGVSGQVRHRQGCTTTEDGFWFEI